MSGTNTKASSRNVEERLPRARLLIVMRVALALFALAALLLNMQLVVVLLLLLLVVLLLLPLETTPTLETIIIPEPTPAPAVTVPLIEAVTRQLSTSLSIGQVANVVLSEALKATGAEIAVLAMPPEVAHFMTIELRRGQENVQIVHHPYTGETLIEQVLQQGHQGRALINRDGSAIAVMLRHEYLVIGALCIENPPGTLSQTEAELLSEIAVPAAISLHNARLLDDQQYQIDTLSHIQALIQKLSGAVDTSSVARAILETARDILGVQEVALYRRYGNELELALSLNRDRFSRSQSAKRLTRATAAKTAEMSEMQITHQPVASVAVPVQRDGEIHEILAAAFIERYTLRQRDLNTLALLAAQTAAHLDTIQLYEQQRAVSERLRMTINSAHDAVLLLDPLGKLVDCNPAAEWMLTVDKTKYIGKQLVVMLFEMMKVGDKNKSAMGYTRTQLPDLAHQLRYEPSLVTRRQFEQMSGGQQRTFEEIGCPIVDAHDQITGRLLVLRDVSEHKQLSEFRDEMIHMAIHDLRGPLTAIMNGIDMTLKLGLTEFPEDNERVLQLSLASAGDLMKLVNGLLDIARLESQKMPIRPQSIMVSQLVESARLTLESSIREAGIDVEINVPDDLPLLNVDTDLMRRVLVNLIDNALRFTPMGEKILIAAERTDDQQVELSVTDSGLGIPPAERERVFERYSQSVTNKAMRGSSGSGLGLSFCKLAVDAHGGRIWAGTSDVLPGACIRVRLPAAV